MPCANPVSMSKKYHYFDTPAGRYCWIYNLGDVTVGYSYCVRTRCFTGSAFVNLDKAVEGILAPTRQNNAGTDGVSVCPPEDLLAPQFWRRRLSSNSAGQL